MENIQRFAKKHEKYTTLLSIVNLTCEVSESEFKTGKNNKLQYAIQTFHVVAKYLHEKNQISSELLEQCEKMSEEEIELYINDTIELWNKVVPIVKRVWRFLKSLKCSKKN